MDDLKFPDFDHPLPEPKKVSIEAYFAFLIWQLSRISPEERRRQLDQRPVPSGAPFTLFPKKG